MVGRAPTLAIFWVGHEAQNAFYVILRDSKGFFCQNIAKVGDLEDYNKFCVRVTLYLQKNIEERELLNVNSELPNIENR